MRTNALLTVVVLALAGCAKGAGPTTMPEEGTAPAEADVEESIPDDDDEPDEEPY